MNFIKNIFSSNSKPKADKVVVQTEEDEFDPFEIITELKDNSGLIFKVGDTIIVRGNEPEDLLKGEIKAFEYLGCNPGKYSNPIPIIDFGNGDVFCMGVMKPYSDSLWEFLNTMPPIDQWNYLVRDLAQIDVKYGDATKTFTKIDIDNKDYDKACGNTLIFNQNITFLNEGDELFYCCDCQTYKIVETIGKYVIKIDRDLSVVGRNPYFNIM